jgi:hypothetical protein
MFEIILFAVFWFLLGALAHELYDSYERKQEQRDHYYIPRRMK